MSNDDLRRGPDDEARTRPSDTPNADPQVNVPDFPEFGELPGFTPPVSYTHLTLPTT